jgi:hypothetical protein
VARYLSLGWIDDLTATAARHPELAAAAAGTTMRVTQVVRDGPEGDVIYHLEVDGERVSFGPGPAGDENVRFVQDWETAVAVATGELNAQEAFVTGRILLTGDHELLLANQPLFAALEPLFADVRARTTYE